MFGIGGAELFIILIFAFLIVGPDKLPEVAKTIGKAIARFRDAQQDMKETLGDQKIFDPDNPEEPFKNPIEVLDKVAQRQEDRRVSKKEQSAPPARSKDAPVASSPDASEPVRESFSERKARYERERAAQKAAANKGGEC